MNYEKTLLRCVTEMENDSAVVASSVRKEYNIGGTIVEALKGVDLTIHSGEFVTVSGPSGAGKTTLLNIISGLEKPTSGEIKVLGHDLSKYDELFLANFRCTNIGYVFQSYNLISTLTTKENLAFPMQLAGWDTDRIEQKTEELLQLAGLTSRADHFPSQLSGGEQQRVAFVRALANDPLIFLADEPTGNLDLETGLKIIEILSGLKRKKTVVVVTHDERVIRLADMALSMVDGKIVL
ncbi:MAG: ABC transporter ATP-binding protein [Candidatus Bathyarchaeia archaeon]